MTPPRYYQREAVDAVFDYWREEAGHPLVDMATGTGKSMTMAILDHELITGWPDMRILNVTHVIELVLGNMEELLRISPWAPCGIYAASAGRRDRHAPIIFGQLQTIWNKAKEIGHVDVLKIDEAHLIPRDAATMYMRLINDLLAINPDMKIVGFTATIYRLDSGRLDEGEGKLFDKVVYTYSISQGIEDGYLSPLVSKGMATRYDLSGVRTQMGDYKKSDLSKAIDKEEVTRAAVEETIAYTQDRKCGLFFCGDLEHARHVRDEVRRHGKSCEMVYGTMPKDERRKIIADLKSGKLWSATNDSVLTTGTNIPNIDFIADMAPTKSTSRYVQKGGRGTRPVYPRGFDPESTDAAGRREAIAIGPKKNCVYFDYARNVSYHGPIDMVQPRTPGKGDGEAPVKECPNCHSLVHASKMTCDDCGHEFEPSGEVTITRTAADAPILASAPPETRGVTGRWFRRHEKVGGLPSVRADFLCGGTAFKSWICPQHTGFAKAKSDRFWKEHGGSVPFPANVDEFLDRQAELKTTAEITVRPNGKYWDVLAMKAGDFPTPANDDIPLHLDDVIPF